MESENQRPSESSPYGGNTAAGQRPEGLPENLPVRYSEGDEWGMAVWDSASKAVRTSIDDSTPIGRQMVSKAIMQADKKIRNAVNDVHSVVHFFAHGVQLRTAIEGEIVPKIRLVMILENGQTISTMSEPCIKAFAYLAHKMGKGPWHPPLRIEVKEFPLGEGRSYCNLCEAAPLAVDSASGKGKGKG